MHSADKRLLLECRHLLQRTIRMSPSVVACTVDLLEIYKVLHRKRYSSETNADRATKIMSQVQHAKSNLRHHSSLYR